MGWAVQKGAGLHTVDMAEITSGTKSGYKLSTVGNAVGSYAVPVPGQDYPGSTDRGHG